MLKLLYHTRVYRDDPVRIL